MKTDIKKGKLSLKDLVFHFESAPTHFRKIVQGISKTEGYKKSIEEGIQVLTDEVLQKIVTKQPLKFKTIDEISACLREHGLSVKPAIIAYYIKKGFVPKKGSFDFYFDMPDEDEKNYPSSVIYDINFVRFALQVGKSRFYSVCKECEKIVNVSYEGPLLKDYLANKMGIDEGKSNDLANDYCDLLSPGGNNYLSALYYHIDLTEWIKDLALTFVKGNGEKIRYYTEQFAEIEEVQNKLTEKLKKLEEDFSKEFKREELFNE